MAVCHGLPADCLCSIGMANPEYDIAIVGAGIVGSALACAVAPSGLHIALIDNVQPRAIENHDYDLRVSAITMGSKVIFETIGVWKAITRHRVSCVDAMEIWDEGGSGRISFNSDEVAQPCLVYIVENRVILHALLDSVKTAHNIEYLAPVQVAGLAANSQHTLLKLDNGSELKARLVVGADGANSLIRKQSGIQTTDQHFEQKAIVATVKSTKDHAHIARQRFLSTGPLAFLPLDDAHHCSIVWSADNDRADVLIALDDAGFNVELQQAFGDRLGKVELVGQRAMFPLANSHAKHYLAERVVLVGDAAHRIHPLAGQGLNLGLGDIAVLAEVLVEAHQMQADIGAHKILRRYERWRKGSNSYMLAAMGGFKRLFGYNNYTVRALRNFGMDLTDSAPLLKGYIMQCAAGQSGDTPKLMRGIRL